MTDIQQARNVLAKWRTNRFNSLWEVDKNLPFSADLVGLFAPAQKEYVVKFDDDRQPDGAVADLIVGTAGNPELLDWIDRFLRDSEADLEAARGRLGRTDEPGAVGEAITLAGVIIAADQRINA
ncbi:hypothetical protein DEJ21_14075 [Curtobacterium sp. MCSS17_006]|uniref:hypothetical protein n=1 Tax=Curtobacterium sp. MCSS17_006 TaxID=2175642 RepID=UPI000DA78A55|nr:hypothetical protein [Curtobacterium sp. MCSS17_006]PZE33972.1 hypothetical protein DEJ21_14075 [Curtobacterium sp. MCSS17_006]